MHDPMTMRGETHLPCPRTPIRPLAKVRQTRLAGAAGACLALLLGLFTSIAWAEAASADEWKEARKVFRSALRSKSWKIRHEAYLTFARHDERRTVEEMLSKLRAEKSAAVVLRGLSLLAAFEEPLAQEALAAAAVGRNGARKRYAVMALRDQPGHCGATELREVLRGKDSVLAGQAAIALGRKGILDALPLLTADLEHKEWQRRAAAARGIRYLTECVHDRTHAQLVGEDKEWEVAPELRARRQQEARETTWSATGSAMQPLIAALERAEGTERRDIVQALECVGSRPYGDDLDAWVQLSAGANPATIEARAGSIATPHLLGLPLYGTRVVLILDTGSDTEDAHPFKDRARLQELCKVPGARDVPWIALRTRKQFFAAHASRIVRDLPEGARFDVIGPTLNLHELFGKLTRVNAGTRTKAVKYIEELPIENGVDHHAALEQALDVSGRRDSVARLKGPDEIVFLATTGPWRAELTDQEEIGARIALKARLRMVPIHTVGVGSHPFAMMRPISAESGGTYFDLTH